MYIFFWVDKFLSSMSGIFVKTICQPKFSATCQGTIHSNYLRVPGTTASAAAQSSQVPYLYSFGLGIGERKQNPVKTWSCCHPITTSFLSFPWLGAIPLPAVPQLVPSPVNHSRSPGTANSTCVNPAWLGSSSLASELTTVLGLRLYWSLLLQKHMQIKRRVEYNHASFA